MVKEWALYKVIGTNQFFVRNTRDKDWRAWRKETVYQYLYVDSSDSKDEIKESLIKCFQLGYNGFLQWKLEKYLSEEKNESVRENLKKFIKALQ